MPRTLGLIIGGLVALLVIGCGGASDEPAGDSTATDAQRAALEATSVEFTALAFVTHPGGRTLAASVAPNDLGIEWVDYELDDADRIVGIRAETSNGPVLVQLSADTFASYSAPDGVAFFGRLDGSELTVAPDGQEPERFSARPQPRPPRTVSAGDHDLRAGGPTLRPVLLQQAGDPREYFKERPILITSTSGVDVVSLVDGAPVDTVGELTGFGLTIEACRYDFHEIDGFGNEIFTRIDCAPASHDRVVISASAELPFNEVWKDSLLEVASERCRAWVEQNQHLPDFADRLGLSFGERIGGFAEALERVIYSFAGITSDSTEVPCGSIEYGGDLALSYDANPGNIVLTLSVSAASVEYTFTTDTTDVSAFQPSDGLTLSIEGSPDTALGDVAPAAEPASVVEFVGVASHLDHAVGYEQIACHGTTPIHAIVDTRSDPARVTITYYRRNIAGLKRELGPGPTENYLICVEGGRRTVHEGYTPTGTDEPVGGWVERFSVPEGGEIAVVWGQDGSTVAGIVGDITVSDFFNHWEMDFELLEPCEGSCSEEFRAAHQPPANNDPRAPYAGANEPPTSQPPSDPDGDDDDGTRSGEDPEDPQGGAGTAG